MGQTLHQFPFRLPQAQFFPVLISILGRAMRSASFSIVLAPHIAQAALDVGGNL